MTSTRAPEITPEEQTRFSPVDLVTRVAGVRELCNTAVKGD